MMTQEQAKAKLATADAKVDFFEDLTERIERMIDEIESARHDNMLWKFGDDWTLADNVKDGWDASETACEGLGYLREVCEQQLNREVKKSETLYDYLTRLEGQAKPVTVTANSVDIDDEDGAHCFDCGKYVADAHDMESGMWIQPSHERGTVNEERFEYSDRYYSEFVCRECYDKHYHQCDECCESYHESRCTQDTNGNFICENCREAQAATDKVTATNAADIDDVQADETRIRLFPDDVRALWLSQQWTWDIDVKADDDDGNPVEVTEEDFADIEGTLRGRYFIDWDDFGGISFFAEDADDEELNLILAELDLRGCRIVENYEEWEVNKAEEDAAE